MSTPTSKRSAVDEAEGESPRKRQALDEEDKENSENQGVNDDEEDDVEGETKDGSSQSNRAGIIRKIEVENFMCHRKLTLNFSRHINFINGQNGSGKSAILAAIQICLGASARRTNRARNLKDLIRRDGTSMPSCAKVRVSVWNEGSDAYKPDVYGDWITVERTISVSSSGYNGFKLFDHNGVEKSRSKKDLYDMLDVL